MVFIDLIIWKDLYQGVVSCKGKYHACNIKWKYKSKVIKITLKFDIKKYIYIIIKF